MKTKKSLDFDLNIISFIGMLAVCICFLLLTAFQAQMASIKVQPSIETQSSKNITDQATNITLLAKMSTHGQVTLSLQSPPPDIDTKWHDFLIPGWTNQNGIPQIDNQNIAMHLEALMEQIPHLSQAIVIPYPQAPYQDVIDLMDCIKKAGLYSLGVLPI